MKRVLVGVGAVVFVVVGLIALLNIYNHSVLIVPGLGPTIYSESEGRNNVELKVNKVSSQHTQVPFAYQDLGGVCPVTTTGENENFGEILFGDRIISHPGYKVRPGFLVLRILKTWPAFSPRAHTQPNPSIPNKFCKKVGDERVAFVASSTS
jgi:hypothetical protein